MLVPRPPTATSASPASTGSTRFDTAIAVAKKFGNSDNVILASGDANHYPDALSANYLAGHVHEPILLTQGSATPPNVLNYLQSSGVKNITIVGGPLAVSSAQEAALKAQGYNVTRIDGGATGDRFDTNAAILKDGRRPRRRRRRTPPSSPPATTSRTRWAPARWPTTRACRSACPTRATSPTT